MKEPGRFRKKPVVIEAIRWTGENITVIDGWIADKGLGDRVFIPTTNDRPILVDTIDGGQARVEVGDWLLIGVKGEPYPCKDDIFRATYEPEKQPWQS